jgi:hypothetical protein
MICYKPMKRGVKPGTQAKKAKLAAEKAAVLEAAKSSHREEGQV